MLEEERKIRIFWAQNGTLLYFTVKSWNVTPEKFIPTIESYGFRRIVPLVLKNYNIFNSDRKF